VSAEAQIRQALEDAVEELRIARARLRELQTIAEPHPLELSARLRASAHARGKIAGLRQALSFVQRASESS
jgi:non-ribosomal peptide synthetase component F